MAISEIYVDPSRAGNVGTGTFGDMYGDLEYGVKQTTFDTLNGTRVNIKGTIDEFLIANLAVAMADTSVTPAWLPTLNVKAIFQGFTNTAGDGGIASISGGESVAAYDNASAQGIHFKDLRVHGFGANFGITAGAWCSVDNCEVDDGTAGGIKITGIVKNCNVHNVGYIGIWMAGGVARNNFIYSDGRPFQFSALYCTSPVTVQRNIVLLQEAADDQDGIGLATGSICDNNAVWSNAGTGLGILNLFGNINLDSLSNNVVSGFSGVGGVGISAANGTGVTSVIAGNSIYNCETEMIVPNNSLISVNPFEILTAEPFTDPINGNFFPIDTGSMKEGGLPQIIGQVI